LKREKLLTLLGSILFILALVALPFMSACAPAAPTPPAEGALKVGALSSCWKLDYSWGTENYRATTMLRDVYGCDVTFIDTVPFADQEKIMTDYAEAGCDLIIGWGYEFLDAINKVARKYPDIHFVQTCAPDEGSAGMPTNLASMYFREEEGGYLCGILAASVTKTKRVAYLSGTDLPCVTAIGNGFRMGVYDTDPTVKVDITYVGSWVDVAKEKELTNAEIDAGCDIIFSYAIGVGIADVVAERTTPEHPIWFIGSQHHEEYKPEVVIATHYLNQMKAITTIYEDIIAGRFVAKPYKCMIENGIITINLMDMHIPSVIPYDVVDKIEAAEQAIMRGDKVVSRLVNLGIRVMPETWPHEPVPSIEEWIQPSFDYVFEGHEDPYYDYLLPAPAQ